MCLCFCKIVLRNRITSYLNGRKSWNYHPNYQKMPQQFIKLIKTMQKKNYKCNFKGKLLKITIRTNHQEKVVYAWCSRDTLQNLTDFLIVNEIHMFWFYLFISSGVWQVPTIFNVGITSYIRQFCKLLFWSKSRSYST